MTSLMDARNRAHDAIVVDDEEALRVALEQTPEVVHHVHGNGNSLLHLAVCEEIHKLFPPASGARQTYTNFSN